MLFENIHETKCVCIMPSEDEIPACQPYSQQEVVHLHLDMVAYEQLDIVEAEHS